MAHYFLTRKHLQLHKATQELTQLYYKSFNFLYFIVTHLGQTLDTQTIESLFDHYFLKVKLESIFPWDQTVGRDNSFITSWALDSLRSDQLGIHEFTNEGTGGAHNKPQETLEAGSQSFNKQVGS